MTVAPLLSIIVPAYNAGETLGKCLEALLDAPGPTREIIVVDDAGQDETASIARGFQVRVVQSETNLGPAVARNEGVRVARSEVLVFVDSDVVVHEDALERISLFFDGHPEYSAVVGSYDAKPPAGGVVSQFHNLLQHFIHQRSGPEIETFWAGLSAIRRSAFRSVSGFDPDYAMMEDVEFGFRLSEGGARIALDRGLLGTHLKKWTLRGMVRTDAIDRAIPGIRIAFDRGRISRQLYSSYAQLASVLGAGFALLFFAASVVFNWAVVVALVCCTIPVLMNLPFFKFLVVRRGFGFAVAAVPIHIVHFMAAATGFVLGTFRAMGTFRGSAKQGAAGRRGCGTTMLGK